MDNSIVRCMINITIYIKDNNLTQQMFRSV